MLDAFQSKPDLLDALLRFRQARLRDARQQKILPDGQTQIAVAAILRDIGKFAHLRRRELADRQDDAEIEETLLLLRMNADMRLAALHGARCDEIFGNAWQRVAELGFDSGEEFLKTPIVEHDI